MTATAYPLTWPQQFPRTKYREQGRFKTELSNAIKNVNTSLKGFAKAMAELNSARDDALIEVDHG